MFLLKILLVIISLNIKLSHSDEDHVRKLSVLHELSINMNGRCFEDLREILKLFSYDDSAAVDMFNSWSTFRSNYTHGNSYEFGKYHQCMMLEIDPNNNINTQYCLIQYKYKSSRDVISVKPKQTFFNIGWKKLNERFGGAVCLPDSCSGEDVSMIMRKLFNGSDLILTDDYNQADYCKKSSIISEFSYFEIMAVFFSVIFFIAIIITTFLDIKTPESDPNQLNDDPSICTKIIRAISIKRTFKDLMNFKHEKSTITCLIGIRSISIFMVIIYHFTQMRLQFPFHDGKYLADWGNGLFVKSIQTANVAVDAFFVISGALVTRSVLRGLGSGKFNLLKFYIQRNFRITPCAVTLIMMAIASSQLCYKIAPYVIEKNNGKFCESHWLETLLYIQVYTNPMEICAAYMWYLSADMQMFLIAPVLIIIARKFLEKKFIFVHFLIIVVAFIMLRFNVISEYNINSEHTDLFKDVYSEIEGKFYYATHVRAIPFIIGMMLGFLLQDNDFLIVNEMITKIILRTLLSLAILLLIIYPMPLGAMSNFITPTIEKFLLTFGSLFWSISVSTIILVCHRGFGGIVNDFLSCKMWTPIAKMSLSFYLVPAGAQYVFVMSQMEPQFIETGWDMFFHFAFDNSIILTQVFLLYFIVEAPFIKIGRIITENL